MTMKTAVRREASVWGVILIFVLGYVIGALQTDCLDWVDIYTYRLFGNVDLIPPSH